MIALAHEAPGRRAALRPELGAVPHFTRATIRDNRILPEHLLVLGGDAASCAAAQAYRRLGADVTLVAPGAILPDEHRELVGVLRTALVEDGVAVLERARVLRLETWQGRIAAFVRQRGLLRSIEASHLLADPEPSARRRALAARRGTPVRVTATDPVLAHAGLSPRRLRQFGDGVRVRRGVLDDPAIGGRHELRASCALHGVVLGASIVGPRAAELLQPWILALEAGLAVDAMTALPHPVTWLDDDGRRAVAH